MHKALLEAERLHFDTVQVFTKNQQQWQAAPLGADAIAEFRRQAGRLGFGQTVSHASYLINLGASDPGLWDKSIAAFGDEMRRCDALGIPYLVIHPGAHVGAGDEAGIGRVAAALRRLLSDQAGGRVMVCLEGTAGQGSSLGWRFEQLAAMLTPLPPERMAVCLDTCHLLAAGYDLTTAEATRRVLDEFDRVVGLERLKVWHLNDSKKPLGSRVDRHEHIGRGCIGLEAFAVIGQDARFAQVPKILETPKEKAPDGVDWDTHNLRLLRGLAAGKRMRLKTFKTPARADAKTTRTPRRHGPRSS
jgi:deoxyribonuclease-4